MTLIDSLKILFKEDDRNPLSPEELRVYINLLKEWNKQGRPEWFEYRLAPKAVPKVEPNVIPKSTLMRIRERLCQRGLIQYVSGNGKVKNPLFKICDETKGGTKGGTNPETNSKEKVSPIPPLKENISEFKEKERITKVIPKKDFDLSFCLPGFIPIMEEWLEYKLKRKENYKTEQSIRKCYHNLVKLSDNKPTIAQMIIDQSIANNWAGLFELKQHGEQIQRNTASGFTSKQEANNYAFEQFLRDREAREKGMAYEVEKPF